MRGAAAPSPLIAVPNVTAHPSADSVPITVLLYDGLLLCGFNVAIKGVMPTYTRTSEKLNRHRAPQSIGMQPFSNSSKLLIISCSLKNLMLISQTVQEVSR